MKLRDLSSEKLSGLLKNPKFVHISLLVGCLMILLIGLSQCNFEPARTETITPTEHFSQADIYAESVKAQLIEIISVIEGVGKADILVTVGTTETYVYAKEGKTSNNSMTDEIVIIDSGSGKTALTEKILKPSVTGVVIVCEGGDDSKVRERIYNTVKAALGISASKIYVTERE